MLKFSRSTPIIRTSAFFCVVLAFGCASQKARVNQFSTFAQAGITFSDSLPPVLDQSFAATVTTDSLVLEQNRGVLTETERLERLAQSDESLQSRLEILNTLRRHAILLRSYFVALQAIAATDSESSGLSDITQSIVTELGELNSKIRDTNIGGTTVSDLVAPAVEFSVATYQSKLLDRELKKHAPIIQRELDLQAAALSAIAEAMKADLESQLVAENREKVIRPYVEDGRLPGDWNKRRLRSLRLQTEIEAVNTATKAAESLRESFVALAENRLNETGILALLSDVSQLLAFVENNTN